MTWKSYKLWYRTFQVSEKGDIRNEKGNILAGTNHKNGFKVLNIKLHDLNGKVINKSLLLHRMVAECFVENPQLKPFVIHKDGNLQNNAAKNLVWATPNEKIMHQKSLGHHGVAKLTTVDVMKIKKNLKNGHAVTGIAKSFNVSHTQIRRIKNGENWM